jgi:hypothetical protein
MSAENNQITIDLNLTQRKITEDHLIQRGLYNDIKQRIRARLESIDEPTGDLGQSNGWVSFIDGTRGAGKSTFLSTTLELLKKSNDLKGGIGILPVIDPSRIEDCEIILLTILQELKKLVEETFHSANNDAKRNLQSEWRQTFKKVAGGLALFQKDHHPLNELDADVFLDMGLERASNSINLRSDLSKLFDKACSVVGVKALLFSFDDADTNSKHAINLLETIRKYLDTPRVLVLVTGDMELYSLLVRDYFHQSLAQHKDKSQGCCKDALIDPRQFQLMRMQDHLEEQYLLKLFPVSERHRLRPLWDLIQTRTSKESMLITFNLNNLKNWTNNDLLEHVKELIKTGFRLKSSSDVNLYTEYFLKQPLRSVLQALSLTADKNTYEKYFVEVFLGFGLNSLYQLDINSDGLANNNLAALTEALFEFSIADGDFDTSAYLRPIGSKDIYKTAMLTLSALVPHQLKGKPGDCITYLFRGPGSIKLLNETLIQHKYFGAQTTKELQNQLSRYVGIGREDDALTWARLASAIISIPHINATNARVIRSGVIALNKKTYTGRNSIAITDALEQLQPNHPAHVFTLMQVSGLTRMATLASIYNQLGLIGRLLKLIQDQNWPIKSSEIKKETILRILQSSFPNMASVSAPPWLSKYYTEERSTDQSLQAKLNTDTTLSSWVLKIEIWLNHSHKLSELIYPSSVFLGKLWPRLFFVLEKISDELRSNVWKIENGGFATLMELYALCIINTFLQEELSHHLPYSFDSNNKSAYINIKNPLSSAEFYCKELARNTSILNSELNNLPFTHVIATCPLITGLINENKHKFLNGINLFNNDNFIIENLLKDEDFKKLNTVGIQFTPKLPKEKQEESKKIAEPTDNDDDSEE